MNSKKILEKAIQKAIDGGWHVFGDPIMKVAKVFEANAPRGWGEYEVYIGPNGDMPYYICTHSALIFNHDFAKALWGEETWPKEIPHDLPVSHGKYDGLPVKHTSRDLEDWINENHKCKCCHKVVRTYDQMQMPCEIVGEHRVGWQRHLQQMVTADDLLKYLGDNL